MIDFLIIAIQLPAYLFAWRRIFRKIVWLYVVEPRHGIQQLTPDYGDIGWGIVGATLGAIFWPLVLGSMIGSYFLSKTQPIIVAEKLGGPMPRELRASLLESRIKELEAEHGIGEPPLSNVPLRGEII